MRALALLVLLVACHRKHDEACTPPRPAVTSEATYYDADGTGKCSFDAGDRMVAAIAGADFGNAAWCGACLDVQAGAAHVVVRVVDVCPGCKPGGLDLSEPAFAALAPVDKGRIPITWHEVECDVGTRPLAFHIKDGSNPSWLGVQVRDHRYPIAAVAARDATGRYTPLARTDYNYFVGTGLGAGPFALQLTDTRGHTVVDDRVELVAGASVPGPTQWPLCR